MNLIQLFGALAARFRMQRRALPLASVPAARGWLTVFDWKPGAFQQDSPPISPETALSNWAIYSCLTLIASDIGKIPIKLMEPGADDIKRETKSGAFSPVLEKPNAYQTRQMFIERWIISKLGPAGNTYVLKQRDNRGVVVEMHVLDPYCVTPLVSPSGSVFYRLGEDWLARVPYDVEALPASEIIHDRAACLFHPLIGVSPIFAVGLSAQQGLSIQGSAENFFRNKSMPGGIITAPTEITDKQAERLKNEWNSRYSGEGAGKTAVLGDGMKYEPFTVNARDSQLTEQLQLTARIICSAYHVPPFKIGLETLPAGQTVEGMNRIYHADCLQALMQGIEALLDDGLGLTLSSRGLCTDFDEDELLKMDSVSLIDALSKAVGAGIMSPNEARAKRDLPPVKGGESPFLQQQDFPLPELKEFHEDERRARATAAQAPAEPQDDAEEETAMLEDLRVLLRTAPLSIRGIHADI